MTVKNRIDISLVEEASFHDSVYKTRLTNKPFVLLLPLSDEGRIKIIENTASVLISL